MSRDVPSLIGLAKILIYWPENYQISPRKVFSIWGHIYIHCRESGSTVSNFLIYSKWQDEKQKITLKSIYICRVRDAQLERYSLPYRLELSFTTKCLQYQPAYDAMFLVGLLECSFYPLAYSTFYRLSNKQGRP